MATEIGVQGLAIPEEHGGSGFSFAELAVVVEEAVGGFTKALWEAIAIVLAVNAAALTGEKDHRTLIRAAHYARANRPDLHWVIAGEGRLRDSLAAEIHRLGLADRVHLIGHVDRVDALIAAADVFVLTSKREGLGSVVLNALALGRPVVATDAGGIPEILPPEVLVPTGSAEALSQKVTAALDHPTPVPFPPGFSAAAMAQGVLDVYRALL